ncbi:CoA-binding protein, partial [bacterium]|nr:CoA-binding protein [bacterium]
VWLQEGVTHPEAEDRARAAGLDVVADRCIYKDWLRLMNA